MAQDLKRSLTIAGHRTSVSLEPEFWQTVADMARADGKSLASFINAIDQQRQGRNLSASLRVYVLQRLKAEAAARLGETPALEQQATEAPDPPAKAAPPEEPLPNA